MNRKSVVLITVLFSLIAFAIILKMTNATDRKYIRVEILNASKVSGLAEKLALNLRRKNCDVLYIARVACDSFPKTAIVERLRKNMANAKIISKKTGCRNLFFDLDSTLNVDVTIIVGDDYKKYIKE